MAEIREDTVFTYSYSSYNKKTVKKSFLTEKNIKEIEKIRRIYSDSDKSVKTKEKA